MYRHTTICCTGTSPLVPWKRATPLQKAPNCVTVARAVQKQSTHFGLLWRLQRILKTSPSQPAWCLIVRVCASGEGPVGIRSPSNFIGLRSEAARLVNTIQFTRASVSSIPRIVSSSKRFSNFGEVVVKVVYQSERHGGNGIVEQRVLELLWNRWGHQKHRVELQRRVDPNALRDRKTVATWSTGLQIAPC